ncbi:MAG: hypothetical protein IT208_14215 [Chthonomonadales bacterium]|nr:hypothetical protein [Chthonomonadales bacterium]
MAIMDPTSTRTLPRYTWELIPLGDLRAWTITEGGEQVPVECARVHVEGRSDEPPLDVAYFTESHRAAVGRGEHMEWTRADGIEEAIRRYLEGAMQP